MSVEVLTAPAITRESAPPATAIPHRTLIRSWLKPVSTRNTMLALALVAFDLVLFAALLAGTIWLRAPLLKLLCGVAEGVVIARLFILGHDACHQSLTEHRGLNRVIGRIVFLASLTPYSLWEIGHNVVHHGYTNLKDFDMVWAPRTLAAYRALSPRRRWLERVYRSGWAPWLYYFNEIWWKKMYFPNRTQMPTRRRVFIADGVLVTLAAAAWIALLVLAASTTGQSAGLLLLSGFALPLLLWNGLIGWVVYVHHTHPRIAWYADKPAWSAAQPFVSTTVHMVFKPHFGIDFDALLHHILEHTAHHVDMCIPLYRLKRAQAILEARMPGHIVRQAFSWRQYSDTARRCKLYDFEHGCWTDFDGKPTSIPLTPSS